MMMSLRLLLLLHPWRCIGELGIALISVTHLMCVANVTRPCTCGACIVTGVGFCLHTLECPLRGRAHPNTNKWLFQQWCQEVDVEEVLTAGLPNEPVSGDEELDVVSNPLLASPPGKEAKKKEVPSSDSEVDLFAPPPTAPVPEKKVEGKKALPSAPPADPPTSKRRTRSTIQSETTPLGPGDWLTDKDVLVESRALPHGNR